MQNNKLLFYDIISIIYFSFLIIGRLTSSYMTISSGLFVLWILCLIASKKEVKSGLVGDRKIPPFIIWVLLSFLYGLVNAPTDHIMKVLLEALMMFSPLVWYDSYKNRIQSLPKVLYTIVGVWIFVSAAAIYMYNLVGDSLGEAAARAIASDREAMGGISIGGGYCIAYGASIFVCVISNLFISKHIHGFFEKLFWALVLIVSVVLVLKTESTITTLSMVIGVAFTIAYRENSRNKKIAVLSLLFLFMVFVLCMQHIGDYLIEYGRNTDGVSAQRLVSLGETLTGKGGDSEYTSFRFLIPFQTLGTFIQNPIIGVSYLHGNAYLSPELFGVGNHCEWSDALADYGLLGGIPFLMVYYRQAKESANTGIKLSIGWLICFFLMGFFNPFRSFQSNIMFFFIIPAIKTVFDNKKIKKL